MTTPNDNAKVRKQGNKDFGPNEMTFGDKSGRYPEAEYENTNSVNHSATGSGKTNKLKVTGTAPGIDIKSQVEGLEAQYPLVQVIETESGHVIEYNDTPGSERVLIKHANGQGVDLRPDGSILVSAQGDGLVEVANGGHKLIVTGEGQLHYSGNLTLNVGGNFDINVGGSFNVQSKSETKTVKGVSRDFYMGGKYTTVNGSRQDIFTRNKTEIVIGDKSTSVKGNQSINVEGSSSNNVKGQMSMTSEVQGVMSAPDVNIAAQSMSVFGNTGTIGGDGIVMHNRTMFTGETIIAGTSVDVPTIHTSRVNSTSVHATAMYATAFNGDLTGTADRSISLATSNASSTATGTNNSNSTFGQTYRANESVMNAYLNHGNYAVKKVQVDYANHLFNQIEKSFDTDKVTKNHLDTAGIRAKKRDEGHNTNKKFNNYSVSSGLLNPKHSNTVPPKVTVVRDPKDLAVNPRTVVSNRSNAQTRVVPIVKKDVELIVEKKFNINDYSVIIPNTLITKGVSYGQFLFGKGSPGDYDQSMSLDDKKQILRNLIPHANFLKRVRDNSSEFDGYNLEIVEGIYTKDIYEDGSEETLTPNGLLDLRTKGQCVVYELMNEDGALDLDKTFELATWMVSNVNFDKLILDYDQYDPSDELNAQIVMVTPAIPGSYKATFKREVETHYNGKKQGNELMKIEKKDPKTIQSQDEDKDTDSNDGDKEPPDFDISRSSPQ